MNFLICVLFILGSLVKTQDDVDVNNAELEVEPSYFSKSHPLRDSSDLLSLDLKESEDVKTSFKIISNSSDNVFYLGDKVEILFGFENTGSNDLYITDVCGALMSPYDDTQFVFNNTAIHHNITVRQNEYHSFYYPFPINPHYNPVGYGLITAVYYVNARGEEFRSVVVNVTLDVKDAPGAIKVGKFFLIILVVGVVVTLGIVFKKQIVDFVVNIYKKYTKTSGRHSGKRTGSGRSRGTDGADEDDNDDWLKNTSTHAFQKQKDREKEKENKKKNVGAKRDISKSPNPGVAKGKGKRGRSPPSDSSTTTTSASGSFVLNNKKD